MSTTRYAASNADPDASPERYLASASLRGPVPLSIICRVSSVLPAAQREAMIWLSGFARLRELTGESLAAELRMPGDEVREALTNPACDRELFFIRVSEQRARFDEELARQRRPGEQSCFSLVPAFDDALCQIADTSIARKIGNAVSMCSTKPQIIEIIGKTRIGKSIAGRRQFLANLHRAAWLNCPKHGTERDFLTGLAGCLGMSFGSAFKNSQIMPKIGACFGRNRVNLLFIDEGQRLLPVETRAEPRRLETVRDLWEQSGISVVILSTPQMSAGLAELMDENPRWAPGQWIGRRQVFDLPDMMTAEDLAAVAMHHAPDATPDAIEQLVLHAQASEGLCGAMVRAIERARFRTAGGPLTLDAVRDAQRLNERNEAAGKVVALSRPPVRRKGSARQRYGKTG